MAVGGERFDVAIGGDPSDLQAAFRDAARSAERFARDASRLVQAVDLLPARAVRKQGEDAGAALLAGMRARFGRGTDLGLDAAALEAIAPAASFRRQGRAAGEALGDGLREGYRDAAGRLRGSDGRFLSGVQREAAAAGTQAGKAYADAFAAQAFATGKAMRDAGGALTMTVSAPLVALGGVSVKLAADAGEAASLFQTTFGTAVGAATREVETLRRAIPQTRTELQQTVGETYNFIRALGAAPGPARAFAVNVTRLAGDLASFKNIRFEEALTAIRAGLAGESEPLRRFGAIVNEAAIQQEALRSGLVKTGETLSPLGKALATFQIAVRAAGPAIGDAERTASSAANSFRFLTRDAQEAATTLGQQLLPVIVPLAQQLAGFFREANRLDPALLRVAIGAAALAAAVGPLLTGLGALVSVGGAFARAAVAIGGAAAGAAGAAGLGGLATAALGLGGILAGGALLAGLAGLAVGIYRSGEAARQAARQLDEYKVKLATASQQQIIGNITLINERIQALNDAKAALDRRINPSGLPRVRLNEQDAAEFQRIESELTRLQGALKANEVQFTDNTARMKQMRDEAGALLKGLQGLGTTSTPKVDTNPARTAMKGLVDDLQGVKAMIDLTGGALNAIAGLDDRLLSLYDRVGAKIAVQSDQFSEQTAQLRRFREELGKADVVRLFRLGELPERMRPKLVTRVDTGAIKLPPAVIDEARVRAAFVTPETGAFDRAVAAVSDTFTRAGTEIEALTGRLAGASPAIDRFVAGLGRGLRGVGTLLDALRAPGGLTARRANGTTDAVGTLGNVLDVVASVSAVVGVAQGIAGLIFTGNEIAAENARLLQGNNEEIRRLRLDTLVRERGASATDTFQRAADLFTRRFDTSTARREDERFVAARAALNAFLSSVGLAEDQLIAFAKSQGIELVDSRGALVAEGFRQLAERLKLSTESLTRFGAGLDAQRDRNALRRELFGGAESPAATIKAELALLAQFAPRLAEAFAGLDINTKAGQDAIREGLRALFLRIDSGALTLDDLGTLAGLEDLIAIIRNTNGALNDLGNAARDVTASLTNVPQGFRIALARFNATATVTGSAGAPLAPPAPAGTGLGASGGANAPGAGGIRANAGSVFVQGGITIVARDDETSDEAFSRWVRTRRSEARAKFGNPSRWPEVA